MQPTCIVVPLDFSGASSRALSAAVALASSAESLHVIHVLRPLDALAPGVVWGKVDDAKRIDAARSAVATELGKHHVSAANIHVRVGDPGREIAQLGVDVGADLIVIPTHGYDGAKRFFLGSVAERVLRHAACDVLVLRRPDAE
jgi:nucleotide-binding universal stress UspA family protein